MEMGPSEPFASFATDYAHAPPAFAESFEALHRVRASTFDTLHSWPDRAPAEHLLPHADAVDDTDGEPWRVVGRGFTLLGGFERGLLYAYVSEEDPFFFVFGSLRQRAPDAFESESAALLLASQESAVIRRTRGEVRMVGALRCAAVCRRCHDCTDGALLGAFSYTFREMADD